MKTNLTIVRKNIGVTTDTKTDEGFVSYEYFDIIYDIDIPTETVRFYAIPEYFDYLGGRYNLLYGDLQEKGSGYEFLIKKISSVFELAETLNVEQMELMSYFNGSATSITFCIDVEEV